MDGKEDMNSQLRLAVIDRDGQQAALADKKLVLSQPYCFGIFWFRDFGISPWNSTVASISKSQNLKISNTVNDILQLT